MNLINHLLISIYLIILIGCNTKTSKTVETRSINQDEEISNQDEEVLNQEIKEEFKLTDDNVIDFLFEMKRILIKGETTVGLANGILSADGKKIYSAENLKVGLFK